MASSLPEPARDLLRGGDVGQDQPVERAAAEGIGGLQQPGHAARDLPARHGQRDRIAERRARSHAASPSEISSAPGRVRNAVSDPAAVAPSGDVSRPKPVARAALPVSR